MGIREDRIFISKALTLAEAGKGAVSPNPKVGCVLVKNGKIIGEGYHKKFGGKHAEVVAIQNAGSGLAGSTAYINLEPCCTEGKTPPCTKALIENKIKKVVISMLDPNPKIKGKGVQELKKNGIEVLSGVFEIQARELNKGFIKWITKGIPWVIGKAAQSFNGYLGMDSSSQTRITNQQCKEDVHRLRSGVDCVLVGRQTILTDDPELTVRDIAGRSPKRAVLDSRLSLTQSYQIFEQTEPETIVLHSNVIKNVKSKEGIKYLGVREDKNGLDVNDVLVKLGRQGITTLLVEGGAEVLKSFYSADVLDEIYIYTSHSELKNAHLKNPIIISTDWETKKKASLGNNQLKVYKKKETCLLEL